MQKNTKHDPKFYQACRHTAVIKSRRKLSDMVDRDAAIGMEMVAHNHVSLHPNEALVAERKALRAKFYIIYYRLLNKYGVEYENNIIKKPVPKFQDTPKPFSFNENEQFLLRAVLERYMEEPLFRSFCSKKQIGKSFAEKIRDNKAKMPEYDKEWRQTQFDKACQYAYQDAEKPMMLRSFNVKFLYRRIRKALTLIEVNRAKNCYLPGELYNTRDDWRSLPRDGHYVGARFIRYQLVELMTQEQIDDCRTRENPYVVCHRPIERICNAFDMQLRDDERDTLIALAQGMLKKLEDASLNVQAV